MTAIVKISEAAKQSKRIFPHRLTPSSDQDYSAGREAAKDRKRRRGTAALSELPSAWQVFRTLDF
jgi:hypothetical protein